MYLEELHYVREGRARRILIIPAHAKCRGEEYAKV
jgi:hypothetical protein